MLKIGTRVRIKSLEWFNKNKIKDCTGEDYIPIYPYFFKSMTIFCGAELEVAAVRPNEGFYTLKYKGAKKPIDFEWIAEFFDIVNKSFTLSTE